jgi:hypothetical protein
MIKQIARSNVKKLYGSFILLFIFMLVGMEPPSWSREVTLEEIEPIKFSEADKNKTKVAIFYTRTCQGGLLPKDEYADFFEALSSLEPQKYKITINPFEINTFDTSKTFAYNAGRKMKVDIVILVSITEVSVDRYNIETQLFSEYTLLNIRNQKVLKDVWIIDCANLTSGAIARQLFNKWKPFLSSAVVPPSVMLEIIANVQGATVTLNGENKGATPLTVNDIAPGQYLVKVSKEGYQSYEEHVRVVGGKTLTLDVSLEPVTANGAIIVAGDPRGAKVYLDGYYCCDLPCTIEQVTMGKHTVKVKNPGYREWDFTVDVATGQRLQFEVVLKRISTQKAAPQQKQVVGEVISISGDSIELDLGGQQGIKVGDTGRVFYKVSIDGKEKPIYVATLKVIGVTQKSCTAQIVEKTGDVQIGYLVEINHK